MYNEAAAIAVFIVYQAILWLNMQNPDSGVKRISEESPAFFGIGVVLVIPVVLGLIAGFIF